jgi:hypothetical protein
MQALLELENYRNTALPHSTNALLRVANIASVFHAHAGLPLVTSWEK